MIPFLILTQIPLELTKTCCSHNKSWFWARFKPIENPPKMNFSCAGLLLSLVFLGFNQKREKKVDKSAGLAPGLSCI